jgi:peptide/nickel transport system substrate-binding protein
MHKLIPEYREQYRQGRISRREFLRYATLLGTSFAAAQVMVGCAPQASPTQVPTAVPPTAAAVATAVPAATAIPAAVAGAPIRGGVLKVASRVQKIDHPARMAWHHQHAITRQVIDYLTYTDEKNVTHPSLLEKWEASDDVKTWTLYLRKGVKFNHGPELTADDVIWNFGQWLNKDVGSSMMGLISDYISLPNIEKVDDYTVRLNCSRPEIGVPEHLYHYVAVILPKDFEGDWIKQPYGTGAFVVDEYKMEERCVLVPRKDGYWRTAANGDKLPYLDRIEYYELGDERSAHIAAMQSGQTDIEHEPWVEDYLALKDNPSMNIGSVVTGQCPVIRMRSDIAPFDNLKLRQALKLCQKREELLKKAYYGQGSVGQDCHVAPVHPDYAPIDTPPYDIEKAKQLVAEAGYPNGIDVELTCGADFPLDVSIAESLKADAEPAGFRINIKLLPGSEYWNVWTEAPFGITDWSHRPLGTMVLNLAYSVDQEGKPAAWNETHWVDEEFLKLLTVANGTLNADLRRKTMLQLEQIQQERGSIGIPFWSNIWRICHKKVKDAVVHPSKYLHLTEVWIDPKDA